MKRVAALFALLGLLTSPGGSLLADEPPHREFVRALRERHYADLALQYLERLGQKLTKNELGGWEISLKAGSVDDAVDTEEEAFERARRFLSYMPSSIDDLPPRGPRTDDPMRRDPWLFEAIPHNPRTPYKMRRIVENRATIEVVGASDPQIIHVVEGFPTTVVSFGSDVPHLGNLGKRLLIGPGSILDAHTAGEKISKTELMEGVSLYERLVRKLLI